MVHCTQKHITIIQIPQKHNKDFEDFKETRIYKNTLYPEIPPNPNDIYVITEWGDRLDLLANQFYGDVTLYWIIAAANPKLPFNSLYPTLGVQLRIPAYPEDVINSFNDINNG